MKNKSPAPIIKTKIVRPALRRPIPTARQNPSGLHRRYIVSKVGGEPVDPKAEYFVLRLDLFGSDLHHICACRMAIQTYATYAQRIPPSLRPR
jgi:hypothetical protein